MTRHFLHDPERRLLVEAAAAGVTTTEYLWLGDAPLAMLADVDTASPRLFWFHTDQLGTPQKLSDSAGNLAWDAVLEPFGELASLTTNLVAQPLRLPGQYADPATGLHQNWWRDYDPSLGRYLQPDPLGTAAGSNLYGYANGNPATYSDSDGQNATIIGFETGFAIGGPPGAAIGALAGTAAMLCALNPSCRQQMLTACSRAVELFDDTLNGGLELISRPSLNEDSSGDSQHTKNKRPSSKNKHEKGQTAKTKSRGGEKGDMLRDPPRRKTKGYLGPWPPK